MTTKTTISNRIVPVIYPHPLISGNFSSGAHGEAEAGTYEFWTATNEKSVCTVRTPRGTEPGERFRKMEGLVNYADYWNLVTSEKAYIRPATLREVVKWLNSLPDDAKYLAD